MLCLIILYIYYIQKYIQIYIYTHKYTNIHNTYLYIYDYIWDAPNQYKFSISYPAQLGRPDPSPICANIGSVCRCIFKKTQQGSVAKPMDTTILFECVMSHSGCFEFCPPDGLEKILFEGSCFHHDSRILGALSLVSQLSPTCCPLVPHLFLTCPPFHPLLENLSKKMILFHHDSPSLHCVSPTTLSRCRWKKSRVWSRCCCFLGGFYEPPICQWSRRFKSHKIWGQRGLNLGLPSFNWVYSTHPTCKVIHFS